jgi:hypothetical protein
MLTANNQMVWRWTVYGLSSVGMEDTLEDAMRRFKETLEAAAAKKARRVAERS